MFLVRASFLQQAGTQKKMKLVVIIPCLNEEATLADVISHIPSRISAITSAETIVLDDGSTDNSSSVAHKVGAKVISNGNNRGLGYTFKHGIETALASNADVIVNMDGDGQFNPQDIPRLVLPITEGKADFVTASRFKDAEQVPEMPKVKLWGNKVMSRMVSTMVGQHFDDVSCGFRAYSREAALRLNLWGKFTYTQESFLDLAVKEMRIVEVPVNVLGVRPVGESRIASNLWKYAARTASILFRSYRDYWPMHFFLWVASPFAVISVLLLSFFLLHYFMTGSFSPHLWAGFSGGGFLGVTGGLLFAGFFADMFKRIRLNQEQIVYLYRKKSITEPEHQDHNIAE